MKRYFKAYGIGVTVVSALSALIWGGQWLLGVLLRWMPHFWDMFMQCVLIVIIFVLIPGYVGYAFMDSNGTWKKKEEEA